MTGWNFACADWEQRLREGRSLVPDLPLFKDKADRAVRIFDKLCVPDIEGQPSFAVAAGEWFRDIVRVIFGSLDDEGVRHVPEVFALVGKKNSKTTSGAGLMVTALLMNEVPWAEFLFIGPTQEIADLAFQQAAGMVEADPDGYLAKRFHVVDHKKTIRDRRNRAFVKVKTFDMKVMTGSKPIGLTLLGRERGTGAMPGGNWSVLDDQVSDDCSRILRCPPWRLSVPWRSASDLKRRVSGRRRRNC